jgi:hypothetical protein
VGGACLLLLTPRVLSLWGCCPGSLSSLVRRHAAAACKVLGALLGKLSLCSDTSTASPFGCTSPPPRQRTPQERHISALFNQSQALSQQLVAARTDASTAQAAASAARQQCAALSLQLEAAAAEAEALRRAAAAATQEAAGLATWCLSRPPGSSSLTGGGSNGSGGCGSSGGQESVGEALRRRDEGLIKWFEVRVAGLVKQSGQQLQLQLQRDGDGDKTDGRLIALVREVRLIWCLPPACCPGFPPQPLTQQQVLLRPAAQSRPAPLLVLVPTPTTDKCGCIFILRVGYDCTEPPASNSMNGPCPGALFVMCRCVG